MTPHFPPPHSSRTIKQIYNQLKCSLLRVNQTSQIRQVRRVSIPIITLTTSLFCVSCGNSPSKLASQSFQSLKSVSSHLLPSKMPIAKVRKEDLKVQKLGKELAREWDKNQKQWVYTQVNYKPATLPDTRGLPVDGGLLPPLLPGQNTTLEGAGTLPDSPNQ